MLAVSPLTNTKDENQGEMESFRVSGGDGGGDEFPDFSDGLDSIDFDDLFISINDGDVLPDLEMDPEILAVFSISGGAGEDYSDVNKSASSEKGEEDVEIVSRRDESPAAIPLKESDKGRKSSKNVHGKRKVKVDWTPELHRRFVQAVEQLGVDKAVPSRILELMGIDCLTRHNIASHLQKYRSHRRHLLAREAEASSWTQRRQMYGVVATGGGKREMVPWVPPTMGFPPITPMHPHHHFRPLHVWGHPSMDQSVMHMWPKHLAHSPSPPTHQPPTWAATPPLPPRNALTPGTRCFPQAMPAMRFGAPPVPGIPPPAMYKVESGIGVPTPQSSPRPVFDFQPSKESIDAAIGDILSKPWQPLPLGLKPPALDSVLVELQRQGIPKIPPTCTA